MRFPARLRTAGAVAVVALVATVHNGPLRAHDAVTTKITWNRELAPIFFARCADCHRPDGSAFSLLTYDQVRPWAAAIKEEVLTRRMPPWGAASGFGSFRNAAELSLEEIERIVNWVDGGAPEAPEPDADGTVPGPPSPPALSAAAPYIRTGHELSISGEFELTESFTLDGIWPEVVPESSSFRILAQLPDGSFEPLLWLDGYRQEFSHPFLLRQQMELPQGTVIHGVPSNASVLFLSPREP